MASKKKKGATKLLSILCWKMRGKIHTVQVTEHVWPLLDSPGSLLVVLGKTHEQCISLKWLTLLLSLVLTLLSGMSMLETYIAVWWISCQMYSHDRGMDSGRAKLLSPPLWTAADHLIQLIHMKLQGPQEIRYTEFGDPITFPLVLPCDNFVLSWNLSIFCWPLWTLNVADYTHVSGQV